MIFKDGRGYKKHADIQGDPVLSFSKGFQKGLVDSSKGKLLVAREAESGPLLSKIVLRDKSEGERIALGFEEDLCIA